MEGFIKITLLQDGAARWVREADARAELARLEAELDAALARADKARPSAPDMAAERRYYAAVAAVERIAAQVEPLRKALGVEDAATAAPAEPAAPAAEPAAPAPAEPAAPATGPSVAQIEACRAAHGDVRDAAGRPVGLVRNWTGDEGRMTAIGWTPGEGREHVSFVGAAGVLEFGEVLVKARTSEELVVSESWDGKTSLAVAHTATSEWLPANARPAPLIRELFDNDVERIWDALLGEAPDQLTLMSWEARRAEKAAKKAAKAEAPAEAPASPWAALAALKAA